VAGLKRFYVYTLSDPRDLSVFYVGKGTASRKNQHTVDLDIRDRDTSPKANKVREILDAGEEVISSIVKFFDSEEEAYAFEAGLIERTDNLLNAVAGGGGDRSVPKVSEQVTEKREYKLSAKEDKFCQVYVELGNASQAYRESYNCENSVMATINRNAHNLLKKNKIITRIEELRATHIQRHNYNVDNLSGMYQDNYNLAVQTSQCGAANGAVAGISRLHGFDKQGLTETINNTQLNVVLPDLELARRMAYILENGADESNA
jgi:hypothetical protein|tara:strand:- start:9620 stop:10405 length:786 start_codon:yes stop_codon:yes gene_type:complete